jgi:hypothetical protein
VILLVGINISRNLTILLTQAVTFLEVQNLFTEIGATAHMVLVAGGGIEPPTRGFSIPCSTD